MLSVRFNQTLTMDPKGRLALPTRLWGRLDADGVRRLVFIVYKQHLRAYTLDAFKKVEERFASLDDFDDEQEDRQRRVLGFATEVEGAAGHPQAGGQEEGGGEGGGTAHRGSGGGGPPRRRSVDP